VNQTYEQWFRLDAKEMIGKTVDEVLGPDAAAIVKKEMRHAFAGESRSFEYKIRIFEEERILSVTHIPDLDAKGAVRGVIVQGQDITDRKRAEAVLLQTEKLAAVGRLSASIAHEINNPLESVTNLLYLAKTASSHAETREYLVTAERELKRVAAITSQTLRFYKQTTSPRPVTSDELFHSVTSILQGRLLNARVALTMDEKTEEPVECFEGEIRQVFINLVGNAIDAMQATGGRLILRSRKATDFTANRKGVCFTVADTGTGMDAAVRERIFEAFYTTKGNAGTGLGLWVSREIIDRHHGTIRVSSGRGRGTVIQVFLPRFAVSR
jgi:PAS domain S-box-containing protein